MKIANRLVMVLFLLALLLTSLGCAGGVSYSDYVNQIPALETQQSRLYIYRTSVLGAAIQPEIRVDDVVVGKAVAQGFIFTDVKPGDHQVRCSTEVKRSLSLTTKPGQTRYVRLDVSMGFLVGHISPKLVDEVTALEELTKCKYLEK